MVTFLLPGAPARPMRTDPPYLADAAAARAAGARTVPVDLDALLSGDRRGAVRSVPPGAAASWYRGPALSAPDYAALSGAVRERGGALATTPDQYRTVHELPCRQAPFEPVDRRRVWWVAGEPVLTTSLWSAEREPAGAPGLARVATTVRTLAAPFVATDLALRRDGVWRVVGVEDGQVVPLPEDTDVQHLFEALVAAGSGMPLRLAGGRVVLTALPPGRCAEVADGGCGGLTWVGGQPPEGTTEAAGMVVHATAAGLYRPGWGVFAIRDGSDGIALGGIGFHGPPDEGSVEIGYDLAPQARGAGWATDATRLLAAWSAARPDVREVVACTEPDNVASQAVLVRAGFHRAAGRDGLLGFRYAGRGPGRAPVDPEVSMEQP